MFKLTDPKEPKIASLQLKNGVLCTSGFRMQLSILHNVLHMDLWEIMVYRWQPDLKFSYVPYIMMNSSGFTLTSPGGANV